MSVKRPTRRFIAGAVCPQCRAVDRIVVEDVPEQAEGLRRRRCVSCGHSDTMVRDTGVEPATRFSRQRRGDAEATPVRLVDPDDLAR